VNNFIENEILMFLSKAEYWSVSRTNKC
jgi:hypothetical protein